MQHFTNSLEALTLATPVCLDATAQQTDHVMIGPVTHCIAQERQSRHSTAQPSPAQRSTVPHGTSRHSTAHSCRGSASALAMEIDSNKDTKLMTTAVDASCQKLSRGNHQATVTAGSPAVMLPTTAMPARCCRWPRYVIVMLNEANDIGPSAPIHWNRLHL